MNPQQSEPAAAATTGDITGSAIFSDQEDSSGIVVCAEALDGVRSLSVKRMLAGEPSPGAKAIAATTVTDAKGHYSLSGLLPGNYTVTANCKDSIEKAVSTCVQVDPGKSAQTVVLLLTLPGQISGKATLGDAATLANGSLGIVVFIAGTSYSAITASDGSYTISGIPPGKNYTLVANKAGYDLAMTTVSVEILKTTAAATLSIAKMGTTIGGGSISGTALLAGLPSSAGIIVYLTGSSFITVSDASGTFHLTGVPAGSYTLMASKDGYSPASTQVSLAAGGSADAGSLTLSPVQGAATGAVSPPVFSPPAGSYPGPQSVSISATPAGASIRYTVDGSVPTASSGILYSGPVNVADVQTLTAIACAPGWTDSQVSSAAYTLPVATPTFSPGAGGYTDPQNVAIACSTPGSSIRYTIDGSAPTSLVGTLYSGPVRVGTIGTGGRLRAIAYKAGRTDSAVAAADFSILAATVDTVAGMADSPGSADGPPGSARFRFPESLTTDGTSLYVADTNNGTIRSILLSTGAVSTLAGNAGVYAGSADGVADAARFYGPSGIASDGTRLYVADTFNNTIRAVVISTGAVTTIAGVAGSAGASDGSTALFDGPSGVATDGTSLYIADSNNCTIRRLDLSSHVVSTLAGTAGVPGLADGTGSAARFNFPFGIATDGGNLYVADCNNHSVRKIVIATGAVSTIAGTPGISGSADGAGAAAQFFYPMGICDDGTDLFLADSVNQTVRKIAIASGMVSTIAGNVSFVGSADGAGSAARFNSPIGICIFGTRLYVADSGNGLIRMLK